MDSYYSSHENFRAILAEGRDFMPRPYNAPNSYYY